MAASPAAKRVKRPFYRRGEIVVDHGKTLKCFKTWPELEMYL